MDSSTVYPSALDQYIEKPTGPKRLPSNWGVYQIQEGDKTIVYRHEIITRYHRTGPKNVVKSVRIQTQPYQLVTDGHSGKPIVVRLPPKLTEDQVFRKVSPKIIGFDEEDHQGEVCPKCGKGILLTDSDMVQYWNKQTKFEKIFCFYIPCLIPIFTPCAIPYCCIAMKKKRLCTNCNEAFEGKWGVFDRVRSTKEDLTGKYESQ
jgi:hypothetical protein